MEVKEQINKIEWNKEVEHPFQTTFYNTISEVENPRYFISSNGEKLLFFISNIWRIKIATVYFPKPDLDLLEEFINWCKKNKYICKISLYDKLKLNGVTLDEDITSIIDLENPIFTSGINRNIKKAHRENLLFKKLNNLSEWINAAEIHASLIKRKKSEGKAENYLNLYCKLFPLNNKCLHLFGAFLKDKLISSLMIFYYKDYGVYSKASTVENYYSYAPAPFLIKHACDYEKTKFKFLDMVMGHSAKYRKKGQKYRIIQFKKRFGEVKPIYIYSSPFYSRIRKVFNKLRIYSED